MKTYGIIDAIKNSDLWYFKFILDEWYFDHVWWRIHHYVFRERCENCRNYHYKGKVRNEMYGTCDIHTHEWTSYHGHCACWNLDIEADSQYAYEDGCERPYVTPTSKTITQISRSGIWQYLYDGEPKWYNKR